jgi:hypothetical protein
MKTQRKALAVLIVSGGLAFFAACVSPDSQKPIEYEGTIRDGVSLKPVSGASVEAFYQPHFFESFPPGIRKPVLISATNSLDDGTFRIAVPDTRRVLLVAKSRDGSMRSIIQNPREHQQIIMDLRPFMSSAD